MTEKEIMRHVDHTQLKAFATWEDIKKLCDEAVGISDCFGMHSAMLHSESEGGIRRTDQYLYGRRFSTRVTV